MAWKDGYSKDDENNGEMTFWPVTDPKEGDLTKKGEFIQGTVTRIKKGKFNLFMVIEDNEGNVYCTPQAKQLVKQIKRLELEEEEIVNLEFLGKGEEPNDPTYKAPLLFRLRKWEDDIKDVEDEGYD